MYFNIKYSEVFSKMVWYGISCIYNDWHAMNINLSVSKDPI